MIDILFLHIERDSACRVMEIGAITN